MCQLTKYEQETIINFNAGESDATVYTRDKAVMRKLDTLVTEFPKVYRCIGETAIDKTYLMPKSCVKYRRPRNVSMEKRAQARELMNIINQKKTF
ncbi:MAG TPA: hypothetical protein PLZ77_03960 [Lachnospiraceae bacterium]|nr:hypothetical protein [Lachnospiraceae bacterium]